MKPNLVQLLTRYPPGTILKDDRRKFWRKRGKIAVTRFHFLTPVGETQEKFYEQKYLLNVPLTKDHKVITEPPHSWMQLYVEKGLCDKEVDALSCHHTAVSKGFQYEQLKTLVQLLVDHGFLSTSEGDSFMADIPLGAQADEEEAEVTDALLTDPAVSMAVCCPAPSRMSRAILVHPLHLRGLHSSGSLSNWTLGRSSQLQLLGQQGQAIHMS